MNAYEKKLIRLYLKTETAIINEIARLRSLGLADYHVVAALRRVQAILASMQSEAWEYTPKMIEQYFYAAHPQKRVMVTSAQVAMRAYLSAISLTSKQTDIVNRLVISLMGSLEEASEMVTDTLYIGDGSFVPF